MVLTALKMLFSGWISWAVLAGVVATGWYFVDDYQDRGNRIVVLEDREKGYRKSIAALKENADQARDELKAQADAREAFKTDVEKTCKVWNTVKDSDTPVGDLLEELKKLDATKKDK